MQSECSVSNTSTPIWPLSDTFNGNQFQMDALHGYECTTFSNPGFSKSDIYLFDLVIGGQLRISKPLPIGIELSGDLYVAYDRVFGVHGDGDSESDALEDLKISLLDYYQILKQDTQRDDFDKRRFEYLRTYLSPLS
jgi:predicted RNase H-like HicB family nuclease